MYGNPDWPFLNVLRGHHRVRPEVYILNNNRQYLANATNNLVSGTVDMDATASVSRSGKVSFLDPRNSLALDYSDSSLYNRFIQIIYCVAPLASELWYKVPIFTGPIASVMKDGVITNVEFKGSEVLAQNGLLNPYTYPAGLGRSSVITHAMAEFAGEISWTDQMAGQMPLGDPWSIDRGDNIWERLKELADGMAAKLYYDGNGSIRISPKTTAPIMTLDSTWLTTQPEHSFDVDNLRNVVSFEGASVAVSPDPDVDKVKLRFEAWPPPQHPFSPQSLARNGKLRIMPQFLSDDSFIRWPDIWQSASKNLEWNLMLTAEATATSFVIPFLEENDVIQFNTTKLVGNYAVTKWSIPLVGDAEMSMNFFSSSSKASTVGGANTSNANLWGRMMQSGIKHGPSGAFNTLGGKGGIKRGQDAYGVGKDGGMKPPKKKNKKKKNKGKGKK